MNTYDHGGALSYHIFYFPATAENAPAGGVFPEMGLGYWRSYAVKEGGL
jgi:hypothetical protein